MISSSEIILTQILGGIDFMKKAVFVNLEKIDFDKNLNFASIEDLSTLAKYEDSTNEEILARIQDHEIVITKELPVSRELINQFPSSVKVICEAGTGYNYCFLYPRNTYKCSKLNVLKKGY